MAPETAARPWFLTPSDRRAGRTLYDICTTGTLETVAHNVERTWGERIVREHNAFDEARQALRACIEALEEAGGDGEPGDMPTPALDAARLVHAKMAGKDD